MSRHIKRLVHKSKKPVAHITKRFSSVYMLVFVALFAGVGTYIIMNSFAATGSTANMWIDANGGACVTDDTGNMAYSDANACSLSQADSKAKEGYIVRLAAGSYGSLSLQATTKTVSYIGAGPSTVLSSISFGGTSGGVLANKVDNKTVDSVKAGNASFIGVNSTTIKNSTIMDATYIESSSYLKFDTVDFDGNYTTDDTIDIYEQDRSYQVNNNITITGSKIHGARASVSTAHPDGLQFCNCSGSRGDAYHPTNIVLSDNEFYDNECTNVRTNPGTGLTVINNKFSDSVNGLSGCNYYATDLIGMTGVVAYNTWLGGQSSQGNASFNNGTQYWTGNVGNGVGNGCDVKNAVWTKNVWVGVKCGSTDKVKSSSPLTYYTKADLKLNADGTPQAGSPVIDAGDGSSGPYSLSTNTVTSGSYPSDDFNGATRFTGTAPDAGAYEYGAVASTGCDQSATTADFSTKLSATQPGQTLCLAAGDYGTFTGVNKASPGIVIKASSGASVTMDLNIRALPGSPVGYFTLDGISNLEGGEVTGSVHDFIIKNSTVTAELNFWQAGGSQNNACSSCSAMTNANIVLDNDIFNLSKTPAGPGLYEGRVSFVGPAPQPSGITIKNSTFENNCADGVQFGSSGNGVTIMNNEFRNINQGSCGPHVDSIQFVGTSIPGPTITGNYFHNNSTGIASYDGTNQATVTNNVFANIGQDDILAAGYTSTSIIEHNTVIGGEIMCGYTHDLSPCQATIRNNIADGISMVDAGGQPIVNDYNLCKVSTCPGAHSQKATPVFSGGATPTSYAGFALTSCSPGVGDASDGANTGVNLATVSATCSGGSAPTSTTAPTISGTTRVGSTLTTTNGTWGNSPTSYTYQWQVCNSSGASCTSATGTGNTTASYKLSCSDYRAASSSTIKVVVTASNTSGSTSSTSSATAAVNKPSTPTKGDFNDDCFINSADLSQFISGWRKTPTGSYTPLDITGPTPNTPDTYIDGWDLNMLVSNYGYRG